MSRVPSTYQQILIDFRMLGIRTLVPGKYQVGPWILHGPAMEKVRQNSFLRTALLLGNPNTSSGIKKLFARNPEVLEGNK